jgi:hypothetical protein
MNCAHILYRCQKTVGLASFAAMEAWPSGNFFWLHPAQFIQAHSPLPPPPVRYPFPWAHISLRRLYVVLTEASPEVLDFYSSARTTSRSAASIQSTCKQREYRGQALVPSISSFVRHGELALIIEHNYGCEGQYRYTAARNGLIGCLVLASSRLYTHTPTPVLRSPKKLTCICNTPSHQPDLRNFELLQHSIQDRSLASQKLLSRS